MTVTPWLSDPDVDIYVGDALEVLRGLPDGSVDCCVTSPPYWGLRDYGTGAWAGGDADCDHVAPPVGGPSVTSATFRATEHPDRKAKQFADVCGKCGAHRVDRQLGLEATPDLYVAGMVAVFAEVRRVLADHGTLWLNIGDSYAGSYGNQGRKPERGTQRPINGDMLTPVLDGRYPDKGSNTGAVPDGLKPKDLCGIPWRLAFALQADGWWLRSDIIWAKPNPMPESVTDRPTKAHEYVFLLSKRPSYWFDQEAVREANADPIWTANALDNPAWPRRSDSKADASRQDGGRMANGRPHTFATQSGRNVRSVWEIATQPYPDAHFATFPEELPRCAILAGCPVWVCSVCGKARERIVERVPTGAMQKMADGWDTGSGGHGSFHRNGREAGEANVPVLAAQTVGWSDCGHDAYRPGTVLDPFLGSGTTAHVARKHGRRCVGIELNETYAQLAARRLQQLSLLADGDAV